MLSFFSIYIRLYLSHDVIIIIAHSPISIHTLISVKNAFFTPFLHQLIRPYLSCNPICITLNKIHAIQSTLHLSLLIS
jgi:hypothetical protein